MTGEFDVWLLVVGFVVGAGLAWLVLADVRRRESEIDEAEVPREALWLSRTLRDAGERVTPEAAEALLRLHRAYLASLPPDDPESDDEWAPGTWGETRQAGAEPTRTGGAPSVGAPRSTSDTPNVDPPARPATDGAGPTQ